jgi:AcrR family transcriptional regulator
VTAERREEAGGRTYAGLSPDARDAERRERLREATLELAGTEGYAAMTIGRICATAAVSTRHFYQIYSSKEDAFVDLYDALTAASYGNVVTSLEETTGRPMAERVAAAIVAYMQPMLADRRVAKVAFVEIMGASPRIEQVRLDYRETLVALVESEGSAAVARGEVHDRDWRFAALGLAGAAIAVGYDWILHGQQQSTHEFERALADLAVGILVG